MQEIKIACIVMAAGNASRFGNNKLMAELDGQSLIQRALDTVPTEKLHCVRVVTQYPQIAELARRHGFEPVENHEPHLGLSHTIALGLQSLPPVDAALFMVADQPCLRRESVEHLIEFYLNAPDSIAAVGHDGRHGNPCLFPARFFPELMGLQGDRGGAAVIRRNEGSLRILEIDSRQLEDIDTPQQLQFLYK